MQKFTLAAGIAAGFVIGCAVGAIAHDEGHTLPDRDPGSNEVLRADLASAEGIEVLISDVVVPANSGLPKHYHPGEEFAYLIEGQFLFWQDGAEEVVVNAGDPAIITPKRIHSVRTGDAPARAIVFRVHPKGEPERVLVDD